MNSLNSGCGWLGRLLSSGWNCVSEEPAFAGDFGDFAEAVVGGEAGEADSGGFESFAVVVVDFVAVAVAFGDVVLSVGFEG